MPIKEFPPLEEAFEDGLLAIGGDLEVSSLLLAYKSGIFPWPHDEKNLLWFSPPTRAILFLDEIHISKTLIKERKKRDIKFFINRDFKRVITNCSTQKRPGQKGTWINKKIVEGYTRFYEEGYAISFECYENDLLLGGGYGVTIGDYFSGESMFHLHPNGSKFALWMLSDYLRDKGILWIDCQVMTPLLESFGAIEIERNDYISLLNKAIDS